MKAAMRVFIFPFLRKMRKSGKHPYVRVEPSGKDLQVISTMIKEGKVKPVVDKVFELEDIGKAHDYLQAGKFFGKIAVRI